MRGLVSRFSFVFFVWIDAHALLCCSVDELAGGTERGSEFGGSEPHGKPKMTDKVIGGAEKVQFSIYYFVDLCSHMFSLF